MATESRTPNADAARAASSGDRRPFSRLRNMGRRMRERREARQEARRGRREARQDEFDETFTPPEAPTSETRTGITDPDTTVPSGQGQTTRGLGQNVVDTARETERAELAAGQEDQARADEFAGEVRADAEETVDKIDEQSMSLEEDATRIQESIANQAEALQEIPGEVKAEFEDLRQQLSVERDASFERTDAQRGEALGQVMQGRSSAMQAAVQGIQGNVNNQVASIQSNPNLTDSQKAGMIAQIKMSGAGAIAPAIGQTVLGFNQLAADVATKFGSITGQLEATGLTVSAELMGEQGAAYAQAQVAVGEMANQLIDIDANTSVAFAQAQSQLLATRTHATMTSNDILLRTLPLQNTPFADYNGSATAAFEIALGLQDKDFIRQLQSSSMGMTMALFQDMIGTPQQNFWQSILSGFSSGGVMGGVMGGLGAFFGNRG